MKKSFLWPCLVMLAVGVFGDSFRNPGVAKAEGSVLVGQIRFQGKILPPEEVSVKDNAKFCGETVFIQPIKVHADNHGLLNAVVSIEGINGSQEGDKSRKESLVLNNEKCRFNPRILVGQKGVRVEILNLDPILHNTHIKRKLRTRLNIAQLPGGRPASKELRRSGEYNVACDKHKFMTATIQIFDHPYYAATDYQGNFKILGIPPGTHKIRVWHETLGLLEKEATFLSQGTVSVDIDYE